MVEARRGQGAGGRPEGRYEEILKFKSGELANMSLVVDSRLAIETVLKDQGFMNATVEEDRKIDRDLKTVDVTLTVDEGDRYAFNRLTIEGTTSLQGAEYALGPDYIDAWWNVVRWDYWRCWSSGRLAPAPRRGGAGRWSRCG